MLVLNPVTGAVVDDGNPDPQEAIDQALGQGAFAPPPDAQAAIDQVMGMPQVAGPAPVAPPTQPAVPPAPTALDHLGAALRGQQTDATVVSDEDGYARYKALLSKANKDKASKAERTELAGLLGKYDDAVVADEQERIAVLPGGAQGQVPAGLESVGVGGGGGSVSSGRSAHSPEIMAAMAADPTFRAYVEEQDRQKQAAADELEGTLAENDALAGFEVDAEQQRFAVEAAELQAQRDALDAHAKEMKRARLEHEQNMFIVETKANAAEERYLADRDVAMSMIVDPYAKVRSGTGKFMGMLAMAGHSWLANMGPGSPVLPDIPGMIQEVIQETAATQTSNRANAWKTAETSNEMWKLARDGAEDEVEAYERYAGFLTEAYHTEVAVNAAKFAGGRAQAAHQSAVNSIIAARSQAAKAARDANALFNTKQQEALAKQIENMRNNARELEQSRISQGPAWYNAKTGRMQAEDAIAARKAKPADVGVVFKDPKTGKVLGKPQTDIAFRDGTMKMLSTANAVEGVLEMQRMAEGMVAKTGSTKIDKALLEQTSQDFDAAYRAMVAKIQLELTGQAGSDKVLENIAEIFPRDEMLKGIAGGDLDFVRTWSQRALAMRGEAVRGIRSWSTDGSGDPEDFLRDEAAGLRPFAEAGNPDRRPDRSIPELISVGSGRGASGRNPDMFVPVEVPSVSKRVYDVLAIHGDRDMTPRSAPRPNLTAGPFGGLGEQQTEYAIKKPLDDADYGATMPAYAANLYTLWLLTGSPDAAVASQAAVDLDAAGAGSAEDEAKGMVHRLKVLGPPDEQELRNVRNTRTVWQGNLGEALRVGGMLGGK